MQIAFCKKCWTVDTLQTLKIEINVLVNFVLKFLITKLLLDVSSLHDIQCICEELVLRVYCLAVSCLQSCDWILFAV